MLWLLITFAVMMLLTWGIYDPYWIERWLKPWPKQKKWPDKRAKSWLGSRLNHPSAAGITRGTARN